MSSTTLVLPLETEREIWAVRRKAETLGIATVGVPVYYLRVLLAKLEKNPALAKVIDNCKSRGVSLLPSWYPGGRWGNEVLVDVHAPPAEIAHYLTAVAPQA